jgi:hypothetical protein
VLKPQACTIIPGFHIFLLCSCVVFWAISSNLSSNFLILSSAVSICC